MNNDDFVKLHKLIDKMLGEAHDIEITLCQLQREFHEFPIEARLFDQSGGVVKGVEKLQARLAQQYKKFSNHVLMMTTTNEKKEEKNKKTNFDATEPQNHPG